MSKENYKRFREGLQAGISALWRPDFMSGVRNGGFEQTLRNICMPYIEAHTGRTAFSESGQRADLLLCGAEDTLASRTRCEFKVNFAQQHALLEQRIDQAKDQVRRKPSSPNKRAADGIIVYAIAELVLADDDPFGLAAIHNQHVTRTPYKKFLSEQESREHMAEVKRCFPKPLWKAHSCGAIDLCDKSGLARLTVWTYHQK